MNSPGTLLSQTAVNTDELQENNNQEEFADFLLTTKALSHSPVWSEVSCPDFTSRVSTLEMVEPLYIRKGKKTVEKIIDK